VRSFARLRPRAQVAPPSPPRVSRPEDAPSSAPSGADRARINAPTARANASSLAREREVDADWNPSWSADWQRHYAALRELVADEHGQAEVLPGFTVHGMDMGKWLARQRTPKLSETLTDGQRERLEQLDIVPLASEPEAPAKPSTTPASAFERGVAVLAQYKARTRHSGRPTRARRAAGGRDPGPAWGMAQQHAQQARFAAGYTAPTARGPRSVRLRDGQWLVDALRGLQVLLDGIRLVTEFCLVPFRSEVVFSRCFIPESAVWSVVSGRARRWCSRW
jgi:hypothetical protein